MKKIKYIAILSLLCGMISCTPDNIRPLGGGGDDEDDDPIVMPVPPPPPPAGMDSSADTLKI